LRPYMLSTMGAHPGLIQDFGEKLIYGAPDRNHP
jgi:hypothetical protein